jgi:two-component sensor histidine kinase
LERLGIIGLMENLLHLIASQRLSVASRYLATAVLVGVFFLIRIEMAEHAGIYGFFVFIPAILLTSLLFDRGSGLLATALSTAAILWLVEPAGSFAIHSRHVTAVVFFVLECVVIAVLCEALRKALEQATRAEREKDLMLQELAHRTKNNLQMIASVLALQARAQNEPALRDGFDAAVARVQVIANAHDRLQPGGGPGEINLRDYLDDLCRSLGDSLRGLRPVAVRVDAEPITAGTDKAVPLGLIVNELVTNAFKYAFPDGAEGLVQVILRRVGNGTVELTVRDNGIGCDSPREGLGSRLVRLLIQQLGGTLTRQAAAPGCLVTAVVDL